MFQQAYSPLRKPGQHYPVEKPYLKGATEDIWNTSSGLLNSYMEVSLVCYVDEATSLLHALHRCKVGG